MDMITEESLAGKPVAFIDPATAKEVQPPKEGQTEDAERSEKTEKQQDDDRKTAADALEALQRAREALSAEQDSKDDDAPNTVDVDAGVDSDRQLSGASESVENASDSASVLVSDEKKKNIGEVEITESDKQAFIDAIVTGRRFRSESSLFGGRIMLKLRARTIGESEAIDSYVRRRINDGSIKVGAEYGDVMRLCLLVADVEQLGEETFPEMEKPLMPVVGPDGKSVEPAWTKYLDVWRSKPEGVVNAVLPEVFKFETKYAEMVKRGADENFW